MLRAALNHLAPYFVASTSPLCALLPALTLHGNFPSSTLRQPQFPQQLRAAHCLIVNRGNYHPVCSKLSWIPGMAGQRCSPRAAASLSSGGNSGEGKEILVQHLLVKEDDQKLLV